MSYVKNRTKERSSALGAGLSIEPIIRLVATHGTDVSAWIQLGLGLAAILAPTSKKAPDGF